MLGTTALLELFLTSQASRHAQCCMVLQCPAGADVACTCRLCVRYLETAHMQWLGAGLLLSGSAQLHATAVQGTCLTPRATLGCRAPSQCSERRG